MPKDVYSKDLNAVLTVPDDWTDEQIWAFEDSQKGNPVAGFVRGVVPGAIQGVSGMVEGVGGLTGSDTVKGLASLMRDNPVSKYLMERTPADYSNPGRTVGEVTGNIGSMLLPGGAARAAGLGSTAVKAATAAGSVAQSAGEATGEVRRNREAGMEITPGQELAAAYAGAPLGLVEAIPLGRLLGHTERISDLAKMGARDIVKRSVGTGLLESGTEATQQAGQNLVERIYNPQQDLLEGLGESAAAGGAAGFTLDMILQAAGKRAAGKLMRNMGRTQGESPAIPDDGVAGIGIRRTADGNPDITAIMPPPIAPTVQESLTVPPLPIEEPVSAPVQPQLVSKADELPVAPAPREEVVQQPVQVPARAAESPAQARRAAPDGSPYVIGRRSPVKVQRGYKVDTMFAVVPAKSLRISNLDDGSVNPNYPGELQPRNRARASSDEQIRGIIEKLDPEQLGENYLATDGAPIIGEDFAVESGNGRSMAFRRIYERHPDKAALYRNWLTENVDRFGLRPEDLAGIESPVLVRIRSNKLPKGVTRETWGRDANERTTAKLSPAEQAVVDAKGLNSEMLAKFIPGEDGKIRTTANHDFILDFINYVVPETERGDMRAGDGKLGVAGEKRIQNAIFAKAYGDRGIIERMSEDPDDNIKSVVGAMVNAAPRFVSMRKGIADGSLHDLDISSGITSAASRLSSLRAEGVKLDDYFKQNAIFDNPMIDDLILLTLKDLGKSKAKFGEMLNDYVDVVESLGDPRQPSMFGAAEIPTPVEIWSGILKRNEGLARQAEEFITGRKSILGRPGDSVDSARADAGRGPASSAGGREAQTEATSRPASSLANTVEQTRDGPQETLVTDLEARRSQKDAERDSKTALATMPLTLTAPEGPKAPEPVGPDPRQSGMFGDNGSDLSMGTPSRGYPDYIVRSLARQVNSGKQPQIALDLFNELKRIGVDDLVSTKLVDGIVTKKGDSVQGAYRDRIITLSLEAADRAKLIQTLNHEAVHAMKGIGMFTDAEWSVLQSALRPELMMSDDERAKYDKYFGGDKARMNEEAIARGIERYVIGKLDLPKPATGIIAKAVNALDAIGLVARRQTAGEVIEAQQRGDIGRRPFAETVTSEASTPQPEAARPKQPASVDTELGDEFDGMDNEATNYSLTPQERQVFDKVFSPPDERGFAQKTKEAIEDYRAASKQNLLDTFATRWRQSSIDRRAGIEKLDQSLPEGPRDAESSAIAATRFADVSGNLATAALTHGRLEYVGTPGRGYFRASDKGDGIFRKGGTLAKLNQAGKMEKMFLAMAAERADELMGEGREKLFTPAEIAIGKQAMQDPEIKAGARELKAHFDSMINVMQASGMLTGDAANKLKAKAYFPFYRVEVDDSGSITATSPRGFTESIVKAPAGGGLALGNLPKLQKLKGGEAKIADPVENIARNTFALTSMAMRNVAAQRVMRDGKAMGYVKQVHAPTKTDNVVKVWINGRPRTFEVLDKVLYDSVMASGIEIGPLMRLLAVKPAQILRESVTSTPAFMVRNALRDSVQTWAQGYTAVPFTRILPGLRSAVMNAPSYDALQRLGVVGTGIRGEGADGTAVNLRNNIGKESMLDRALEGRKKALAASEGINRVAVFDEVRSKRGGSEIQAAYEALELLNFNRRGASPIAQLLGATIPFLNARAQGLDVLYRSAAGRGMGGKKMQRAVINRGIALAGLSTLYALLSMGQDYYENAAPEERDMFWFVPTGAGEPLKVPIPFELGIFSKVLPERFTNLYFGGDNATDLRKSIQRAVSGVMEIDLPQAVKPVNEVLNNYDTFRQRAIESAAMQRLEAPFRYDEYTSEIAKAIGQVTGASPLQVDHIMKGYTGGLGVMALGFLDYLIEGGTGPEARVSEPHTLPVVGSLFQRRDGGRALVDFYEMRDIAEQAAATQRAMAAQGITEAPDKIAERARKAAVEAATRPTDLALAKLRKYRKMVQSSTELDPAQKRDALNEIRRREIELVKPTKGLRELLQ